MKKTMGLILMCFWALTAVGCAADATTTATTSETDPIVGVWIIPVGASIPPYFTNFNDPWALKFYLEGGLTDAVLTSADDMPFFDVSLSERTFDGGGVDPISGYALRGSLGIQAEGTTFGFAYIYRNDANLLYAGEQHGYYFTAGATETTISVVQIIEAWAIEIEFRFIAIPSIETATVMQFNAIHELIETTTIMLTTIGPWVIDAAADAAYAVIEETLTGGEVHRSIFSRVSGQTSTHAIFRYQPYGYAMFRTCDIVWGE